MHGGNTGNVDVLLGNGDGTFGTPISTPLGVVSQTNSIASGDFSGDGKLDVAGAIGVQNLLGNGNGTFQPDVRYTLGATVQDIVPADFNGDGILDLAVDNSDASLGQVSVFLGNGDGTFQTPTNLAVGVGSLGIAVADINSDGKVDLVVGTSSGFSVWLGNGDGTFSPGVTVPVMGATAFASNVAVADFNNSGHPGVAVATKNSVFVFLQGPLPTLFPSPAVLTFAPQAPGTSSSAQTVTLTNSGTATLTVSGIGITGANATDFAHTNNCVSALAANASCQINVTSTSNAAGTQTAALNITDNAPGNPQTVALNGMGQDFSLGVTSQMSITVTPGQAANHSVVVATISGFN
jgi:FG-GAP-like repeat